MELWIVVVVVLNIVIVAVLVFLILRLRQLSTEDAPQELEGELERVRQLVAFFEAKEKEVRESLEKIRANQSRLDNILNNLEEAIERLRQTPQTEDDKEHLYRQARDMLKSGLPQEEVMKRLNLSRGEITLILTVEKMRKN